MGLPGPPFACRAGAAARTPGLGELDLQAGACWGPREGPGRGEHLDAAARMLECRGPRPQGSICREEPLKVSGPLPHALQGRSKRAPRSHLPGPTHCPSLLLLSPLCLFVWFHPPYAPGTLLQKSRTHTSARRPGAHHLSLGQSRTVRRELPSRACALCGRSLPPPRVSAGLSPDKRTNPAGRGAVKKKTSRDPVNPSEE